MKNCIPEYGPDGLVRRFYWSSEYDTFCEAQRRLSELDRKAETARQRRPAPWIEAWLAGKKEKP